MANPADPGQPPSGAAALPALCRALSCLEERGFLDVEPLLERYRALAPAGHPGALDDTLDLDFLAGALALCGLAGLGASHIVVTRGAARGGIRVTPTGDAGVVELEVPPAPDAAFDAFALISGLAVEARKIEALLGGRGVDDAALPVLARSAGLDEAGFAAALGLEPDGVPRALRALLAGGSFRTLHLGRGAASPGAAAPVDEVVLDAATHDAGGPLFVLAGATERLHDVVSPYARRLTAPLSRLAGASDGDALYEALPVLYGEEPRALGERLEVEARDGVARAGDALVLRLDAMDPALADPRARESLRALKKVRARAVLTGRHPETLARVLEALGARTRAVIALSEGFTGDAGVTWPDLAVDAGSGHVVEIDNALAGAGDAPPKAVTTLPSLGLAPAGAGLVDTLQFPLLTATLAARARGHLPRRARLAAAVTRAGDPEAATAAALVCLARMAATRDEPPARPPARGR